jgi:hypothetical protein
MEGFTMSKKSVVLMAGLGLAATAAGAWVVRRRTLLIDAIETDAVVAPDVEEPFATAWIGDDEDALAGDRAAAADDEPVNIR